MKLIGRLFIAALVVLLVYNFVTIGKLNKDVRVLRAEVRKLRAEVYDLKTAVEAGGNKPKGARLLMSRADDHAKRANKHAALAVEYGRKGDLNRALKEFGLAKQEYGESLRLLKAALGAGTAPAQDSVQKLEKSLRDTGSKIKSLFESMDKAASKPAGKK